MKQQSPDIIARGKRLREIYESEETRILELAKAGDDGDYQHPVFGKGSVCSSVVFIGEAPGADEAANAAPFVGKAGKQLDRMLMLAEISREDVFVTNTVKFRPTAKKLLSSGKIGIRNRTPSAEEVRNSLPTLKSELSLVCPKVIVTLGNTPLSAMLSVLTTNLSEKTVIGSVHGHSQRATLDNLELLLYPLYHPASGIYNRELVSVMEQDLKNLQLLLRKDGFI